MTEPSDLPPNNIPTPLGPNQELESIPLPEIRDAQPGDGEKARSFLEIWVKDSSTGQVQTDEVSEIIRDIEDSSLGLDDKIFKVADNNGEVVGIMGLARPSESIRKFASSSNPSEIINAFVDPNYRGGGVGKLLVDSLEHAAVQNGTTELLVSSGPRYKETAWKFWEGRFGNRIGVQKDLYGPGTDTPVWGARLI
jgi:GNAT superfamily N-acetyltransferase